MENGLENSEQGGRKTFYYAITLTDQDRNAVGLNRDNDNMDEESRLERHFKQRTDKLGDQGGEHERKGHDDSKIFGLRDWVSLTEYHSIS